MLLTRAMGSMAADSEVMIFRSFIAKLMSLEKQLDTSYHRDRYLRCRLLTGVYIPHLRDALCDRVPRAAQQNIHPVMNHMSSGPRTAGSVVTENEKIATDWTTSENPGGIDDHC